MAGSTNDGFSVKLNIEMMFLVTRDANHLCTESSSHYSTRSGYCQVLCIAPVCKCYQIGPNEDTTAISVRCQTAHGTKLGRATSQTMRMLTKPLLTPYLLTMASLPHKIALAWCASFQDLDADANLALRTPDCIHNFAPASLNMPSLSNDQFAVHIQDLKAILSSFPVTPKQIFAQEGSRQVAIWATSDARFREEVKSVDPKLNWSYYGEYMFVLQLYRAGDKIEQIAEFLDSKKVLDLGEVMTKAKAYAAAKKETGP